MKKKLLIFSFILSQLLLGCEKNDVLDESILKGEVIRVTCASTVVQIKNAEKFGEDGWMDEMSASVQKYDNVFKVENICKVNLEMGKIFQFKIISLTQNDCIQCLLYDAPPKVSYAIEVIP
jgi:major membrane immunogen (membrane-anchored lipoprotein)